MYKFHHHCRPRRITNNMTYTHTHLQHLVTYKHHEEMSAKLHFEKRHLFTRRRKTNKTGSFRQLRWSESSLYHNIQ